MAVENNINDYVTVTLTDEGQEYLSKFISGDLRRWPTWAHSHPHASLNNGEVNTWQLWELMRVFGPGLTHGGPTFFEGNAIGIKGAGLAFCSAGFVSTLPDQIVFKNAAESELWTDVFLHFTKNPSRELGDGSEIHTDPTAAADDAVRAFRRRDGSPGS